MLMDGINWGVDVPIKSISHRFLLPNQIIHRAEMYNTNLQQPIK